MACLTLGLTMKPTPPTPVGDAEAASSNHPFPSSNRLTGSPSSKWMRCSCMAMMSTLLSTVYAANSCLRHTGRRVRQLKDPSLHTVLWHTPPPPLRAIFLVCLEKFSFLANPPSRRAWGVNGAGSPLPRSHLRKSMRRSLRVACRWSLTLAARLRDLDLMATTERFPRGAPRFLLTHLVTAASVTAERSSAVVPRLGGVICEVVDMMEGRWWKLPVYRPENAMVGHFLNNCPVVKHRQNIAKPSFRKLTMEMPVEVTSRTVISNFVRVRCAFFGQFQRLVRTKIRPSSIIMR